MNKGRVTERFGDRVQHELEHNIKAVEVESKEKKDDGTEEAIKQMDSRYGRISYYISPKLLYEGTGYVWNGEKA